MLFGHLVDLSLGHLQIVFEIGEGFLLAEVFLEPHEHLDGSFFRILSKILVLVVEEFFEFLNNQIHMDPPLVAVKQVPGHLSQILLNFLDIFSFSLLHILSCQKPQVVALPIFQRLLTRLGI